MNPHDKEPEAAWQQQALAPDVDVQEMDNGRLIMDTGRQEEWLVFES